MYEPIRVSMRLDTDSEISSRFDVTTFARLTKRAIAYAAGFISNPVDAKSRLADSKRTVPLPQKGSNVVSPEQAKVFSMYSTNSGVNWPRQLKIFDRVFPAAFNLLLLSIVLLGFLILFLSWLVINDMVFLCVPVPIFCTYQPEIIQSSFQQFQPLPHCPMCCRPDKFRDDGLGDEPNFHAGAGAVAVCPGGLSILLGNNHYLDFIKIFFLPIPTAGCPSPYIKHFHVCLFKK